jgi:hypothetical protein
MSFAMLGGLATGAGPMINAAQSAIPARDGWMMAG